MRSSLETSTLLEAMELNAQRADTPVGAAHADITRQRSPARRLLRDRNVGAPRGDRPTIAQCHEWAPGLGQGS